MVVAVDVRPQSAKLLEFFPAKITVEFLEIHMHGIPMPDHVRVDGEPSAAYRAGVQRPGGVHPLVYDEPGAPREALAALAALKRARVVSVVMIFQQRHAPEHLTAYFAHALAVFGEEFRSILARVQLSEVSIVASSVGQFHVALFTRYRSLGGLVMRRPLVVRSFLVHPPPYGSVEGLIVFS